MSSSSVVIAGAGIFGVTAAIELRRRGWHVKLLDPGPLPHPLAESTDISKAIRMDYGADEDYMMLMAETFARWREWNARWGEPIYHETGFLLLVRQPMSPGEFEYESFQLLSKHGHQPQRMTPAEVRRRYPTWNADHYVDGYFNPVGGFAESGKVVAHLLRDAQAAGVELFEKQLYAGLIEQGGRVSGIHTADGTCFESDWVIIAAGSWTQHLLPELSPVFRGNGMPVFHLRPADPDAFRPQVFPGFGADVTRTGYYGFPLHPSLGVVKIANHGIGRALNPHSPERVVTQSEIEHLRAFLQETFPSLARAPIGYTRMCIYCDTWDGHFWIAPDPDRQRLVVATGGSGHAFKFAPVLGSLIADATEGTPNALLHKFRWRPDVRPPRTEEAARHQ